MLFSRCLITRVLTIYELVNIVVLEKDLENDVSSFIKY